MSTPLTTFYLQDFGRPYCESFEIQKKLHALVLQKKIPPCFLVTEHSNVITLGKNAAPQHLLTSKEQLAQLNIDFVHSDRGGEITAHMPGQLVVYPIIPLVEFGLGVRSYIQRLEESIILALKETFHLEAKTDPHYPGVWIGEKKVCAIGVRIKEKISMHGFALNVKNSLSLFNLIRPCGIEGRSVCSIAEKLDFSPTMEQVWNALTPHLSQQFSLEFQQASLEDIIVS